MKGGKRKGSGRKKTYVDSETITLRIPKGTKQQVKDFIEKLREDARLI